MATTQQFTERKVKVNGMDIHMVDWGNHHLDAKMLWVHGMSGTGHYWDLVAPQFHENYHLVCPTLRGRGQSDYAADGGYTTEDYVADLNALVEHLGWKQFVFVGASLGGRTGLAYTATYPAQVERLVLVDIGTRVSGQPQRPGGDRFADAPENFSSPEDGGTFLRQFDLFAHLDEPAARLVVREGFEKTDQGQWTWAYDPVIREQRRRALESGQTYFSGQEDEAQRIGCPTLIIRGSRSDVLTPEIAKETLQAIKGSRMVEVQDSGHLPYLEQRGQFTRALKEFLAGN
ncbi:MAG: alpha/beta hydrolase [Dehalococcoidia bacterium]